MSGFHGYAISVALIAIILLELLVCKTNTINKIGEDRKEVVTVVRSYSRKGIRFIQVCQQNRNACLYEK